MNTTTGDRIEKTTVLRAPRSRVWRAIADAGEFGSWFQVKFEGRFAPGAEVKGAMTMPGHEGNCCDFVVESMEPERLFSFTWHPDASEPGLDLTAEPLTLVEFRLEDAPERTLLTITESGFDGLSLERRARAFAGNSEGWDFQLKALVAYVTS
jgi:uncharacterized protein YndB with AHSA1/START domain